jgi:hypothetical protein
MTTTSIQLGSLVILLATLGFATTNAATIQHAMAKSFDDLPGPAIPFTMKKDQSGNWVDVTNTNTNNVATSDHAKSDSAAVANSKNDVKCFAFCFGTSTANAGSAADSRVKSPSAAVTQTTNSPSQLPVIAKKMVGHETPTVTHIHNIKPLVARSDRLDRNGGINNIQALAAPTANTVINSQGTECIDNAGTDQDNGYAQGYFDGNRDSITPSGHGFDDSVHHGNAEFKQGYHNGYADGYNDGTFAKNKQPC